jgi:hypothetical protein
MNIKPTTSTVTDQSRVSQQGEDQYMTFAVYFDEFLQKLVDNRKDPQEGDDATSMSEEDMSEAEEGSVAEEGNIAEEDIDMTTDQIDSKSYKISFIQVCRNHCHMELKELCEENYLKWMFNASCAVYLPTNFPVFDILASIRYHKGITDQYIPFLVSVKCRCNFRDNDVNKELECMKKEMRKNKIGSAFCLLVVLDSSKITSKARNLLENTDFGDLSSSVVTKALVIGPKDTFGIANLVEMTRFGGSLSSEIYSSHSIVRQANRPKKSRYKGGDLESFQGLKKSWK